MFTEKKYSELNAGTSFIAFATYKGKTGAHHFRKQKDGVIVEGEENIKNKLNHFKGKMEVFIPADPFWSWKEFEKWILKHKGV